MTDHGLHTTILILQISIQLESLLIFLLTGGIVEVRVGSPEGNLLATLNATVAAGARAGGAYGAGSLMKMKVNKLGINRSPNTLPCI